MANEVRSDWWTARKQAAAGATPPLQGPEAAPWRRSWLLSVAPSPTGDRRRSELAEPQRLTDPDRLTVGAGAGQDR